MGQFLFDVPEASAEYVEKSLWKDAYICGIEGVPWQSHVHYAHSRLTVTRTIESSGKLFITCPVDGVGYRTLSTCSLRPQEEPYLLVLELARGCCFRARAQSDAWQRAGLTVSQQFSDLLAGRHPKVPRCRSVPCGNRSVGKSVGRSDRDAGKGDRGLGRIIRGSIHRIPQAA